MNIRHSWGLNFQLDGSLQMCLFYLDKTSAFDAKIALLLCFVNGNVDSFLLCISKQVRNKLGGSYAKPLL